MLLETLLIFAGAVFLMVLRVPVAFAFSVAAIGLCLVSGVSISWGLQQSFGLLLSFGFLALPLYMFLGAVVAESGMAERLANLFSALIGRVRGGLGASVILTNAVFGAISGSALAALSGLGRAFLDPMEKRGYPRPYTTALLIPSSTLSQMIPPSGHMIVYGFMAQLPISLCFVAPVIPGLILVAFMLVVHFFLVRKIPSVQKVASTDLRSDVKQVATASKRAFFPMLIPIGILGGIYGGIWTPTEAAGAGVVYTLIIGFLVYRVLKLRTIGGILSDTGATIGSIAILFFFFLIISRVLIMSQVSDAILDWMLSISTNKWAVLAMLNVLMLFMGMIMDDASGTLIAALILLPVAQGVGFDPYHFAAIADLNMSIGLLSPPVAPVLYMGGQIAGVPLNSYVRYVMYFIVFAYLPTMLLTMFIPQLSTVLPHMVSSIGS